MSNLTELRDRVLEMLADTTPTSFTADRVDESLHRALDEYSQYNPLQGEALLDLPGDGWEIALDSVTGLLRVMAVHWPYDSTLSEASQLENKINHWFLWWDDARPIVTVVTSDNSMPVADDEMRLWYELAHTVDGLVGETLTSLPVIHESLLVTGAAGFAAMSQSSAMMLDTAADMYAATLMATWGRSKEREFRQLLSKLAIQVGRSGQPRRGWQMDKWDRVY
jgi:hypothetical protein